MIRFKMLRRYSFSLFLQLDMILLYGLAAWRVLSMTLQMNQSAAHGPTSEQMSWAALRKSRRPLCEKELPFCTTFESF